MDMPDLREIPRKRHVGKVVTRFDGKKFEKLYPSAEPERTGMKRG
jgi:hypothetical protein